MRNIRFWGAAAALVVGITLVGTGGSERILHAQAPTALRQFSGTPIDVDYSAANLRAVLRILSEIGGTNLVIDPSVSNTATVDLKLTQVPWDQVMDVVLKTSGLTYDLSGSVLRVLTREARTKELKDLDEEKKASAAAPDLETVRIRLSYATAADMAKLVKDAGLVSGSVQVDERANMLIVKDRPRNIQDIQSLMTELDKPEPQVEIEAKIIRTNRDTAKALGVQWGMNGRVAPELGNTTSVGFPNRGSIDGRVGGDQQQGPNDPRATTLERNGTMVNLPVPGASTALGLSMGSINGALGLDLALTALQHEGKATILSTPRVTTQNNKLAEITQGFQVPIQIVANNTVTVQFKDAALKLTVMPQITAANTVIMKIALENNTPDFSRAVNGNPSINTQRAETQVQVADGTMTVIGGILQTTETNNVDATPGMNRVPLLGWLFKRTDNRNESQELLIFITPRIIRG